MGSNRGSDNLSRKEKFRLPGNSVLSLFKFFDSPNTLAPFAQESLATYYSQLEHTFPVSYQLFQSYGGIYAADANEVMLSQICTATEKQAAIKQFGLQFDDRNTCRAEPLKTELANCEHPLYQLFVNVTIINSWVNDNVQKVLSELPFYIGVESKHKAKKALKGTNIIVYFDTKDKNHHIGLLVGDKPSFYPLNLSLKLLLLAAHAKDLLSSDRSPSIAIQLEYFVRNFLVQTTILPQINIAKNELYETPTNRVSEIIRRSSYLHTETHAPHFDTLCFIERAGTLVMVLAHERNISEIPLDNTLLFNINKAFSSFLHMLNEPGAHSDWMKTFRPQVKDVAQTRTRSATSSSSPQPTYLYTQAETIMRNSKYFTTASKIDCVKYLSSNEAKTDFLFRMSKTTKIMTIIYIDPENGKPVHLLMDKRVNQIDKTWHTRLLETLENALIDQNANAVSLLYNLYKLFPHEFAGMANLPHTLSAT